MIDSVNEDVRSEHLTGYFRRFSPDYVRMRIFSSLTEVLQRAGRYEDAIELLQYLLGKFKFINSIKTNSKVLDRPMYRRHRRGKLWNRLALIQEKYVKTHGPQQCLDTIYQALQDSSVDLGDRLALCERAKKLYSRKKLQGQLKADWIENEEEKIMMKIPLPKEVC